VLAWLAIWNCRALTPLSWGGAAVGTAVNETTETHITAQDAEMEDVEAIKLLVYMVKIIFDIEAESKKDAAEKIHRGFHDVASYVKHLLSKQVGSVFDANQKRKEVKLRR
jgi:hypothetical protein